jgi:ABC-type sugar transport system permease subunit
MADTTLRRPIGGRRLTSSGRLHRLDSALGLLNLPALALVIGFSALPIIYVVYLSLLDTPPGAVNASFAGLANYRFVLADPSTLTAIWNTIYFSTCSVVIATVLGFGIALLLDSGVLGTGWLIFAVVLPWAVPDIVNALMWQWIYNPTYGALNGMLVSLGLLRHYTAWLSTPVSAMNALIFAFSWKLVPFVVVILYPALQSIPADLYQSAQIDGAGDWSQLRYITFPLMAPALAVAVLFGVVWSMRTFDIVYILTGGGPGESTTVLSYFVFTQAFQFGDLGAASAVACILALITFVLTAIYIRVLPQRQDEA